MLLSIITPTYKRVKYLKKNLIEMNLLNSTFKSFEWIIIVEKKDKTTIEFLRRNKKKFIKLIIGKQKSVEQAFEKGVQKSKGKYINFHGDDDFFELKNFSFINKKLFLNGPKWIIFYGDYINDQFKVVRKIISFFKRLLLNNHHIIDLSLVNYIMSPSVFIMRRIFIKMGGFGSLKRSGSDYLLWMKLKKKYKPKIIKKRLTFAMITKKTISGSFDIEKYLFLFKQMQLNNQSGILGKILIFISMISIIFYNFISKKVFK